MNPTTAVRLIAYSRVALGVWLTCAPRTPARLWFGGDELPASTEVLIRSVGARDIGLGLGLATDPTPASPWLTAGILADAVDTGAALLVRGRVPRRNSLIGVLSAGAYTLVGAVLKARGNDRR